MPRTAIASDAGPRTAMAGPDTVGATAATPGVRTSAASTCFQPVIERIR